MDAFACMCVCVTNFVQKSENEYQEAKEYRVLRRETEQSILRAARVKNLA